MSRSSFTPLDPEDIHALSSRLDDILDALEEAAHRIWAYRVDPVPGAVLSLCEILSESARAVEHAIAALAQHGAVGDRCLEIDRLESEADILMRQGVEDLFAREHDAIAVMKVKEILEFLEEAIDRCEDTADIVRKLAPRA